jgi:2-hydroxychromene-2-carboxylate isomerase
LGGKIDFYFSLQSPWAYIGLGLLTDIVRRHDVVVRYKAVSLLEVFAETGGLPLAKRHPVRQAYRFVELQRWRDKRRLTFNLRPQFFPFNVELADCAVIALQATGANAAGYVRRAAGGVWEREENLADAETIGRLLEETGHDAKAILELAQAAETRAVYQQNRLEAIAAGVFGSPAFVLNGEVFWGQDRLELLDEALASGRAPFLATV